MLMISFLQDLPQISLQVRLFVAFIILQKAVNMYLDNQLDVPAIQKELYAFCNKEILDSLDEELRNQIDEESRFKILRQLPLIIKRDSLFGRFDNLVQQAVHYFEQVDFSQYIADLHAFKESCGAQYRTFYTNYWTYKVFSDSLSIPDYEKSKEKLIYTGMEFAMFQCIALASFLKNGRLYQEEYNYIITSLSRTAEDNLPFRELLTAQIKDYNLVSPAGLLLFVLV